MMAFTASRDLPRGFVWTAVASMHGRERVHRSARSRRCYRDGATWGLPTVVSRAAIDRRPVAPRNGPTWHFRRAPCPREVLARTLRARPAALESLARRSRERYAKWQRVAISEDLVVALRARGGELDFAFLFADGVPFGGGSGGLPTACRASLIEQAQMWLSGGRGTSVHYFQGQHKD